MNTEKAEVLVKMLRERFYGDELTDFEVIDKAWESFPSPASFACLVIVFYYQATQLWVDHVLWILLGCAVLMISVSLFLRRQRKLLSEARVHFIRQAPQHFSELRDMHEKGN